MTSKITFNYLLNKCLEEKVDIHSPLLTPHSPFPIPHSPLPLPYSQFSSQLLSYTQDFSKNIAFVLTPIFTFNQTDNKLKTMLTIKWYFSLLQFDLNWCTVEVPVLQIPKAEGEHNTWKTDYHTVLSASSQISHISQHVFAVRGSKTPVLNWSFIAQDFCLTQTNLHFPWCTGY